MTLKIANEIDPKWKPVLRGRIYCAPRCGCNCTKAAYDKAVKDSNSLAARMGAGWEPVVWENMGWHWRVEKGVFEVWPPSHGSEDYTAWFQNETRQFIVSAKTPEDALGFVIQDARTAVRRIENEIADLYS